MTTLLLVLAAWLVLSVPLGILGGLLLRAWARRQ